MFISKSFKELFFNGFLFESGCKGKDYFWTTKTFSKFFFKKVFFESGRFKFPNFVQYFNSSAFLSRKRVQKYCFTAYPPNHPNTFFILFCHYQPKSLILKRCRRAGFQGHRYRQIERLTLLFIRAHAYTRDSPKQPAFHTPQRQVVDSQRIMVYDIRDISCTHHTLQKRWPSFLKTWPRFKKRWPRLKKTRSSFKPNVRM